MKVYLVELRNAKQEIKHRGIFSAFLIAKQWVEVMLLSETFSSSIQGFVINELADNQLIENITGMGMLIHTFQDNDLENVPDSFRDL